jgi:hypothetical protein
MNDFLKECIRVEEKWWPRIEAFFAEKFKGLFIPSHDFTHHTRTWIYSKQILAALSANPQVFNKAFITDTFWASMFHDIGLTESTKEDHGKISVELFREFIHKQEFTDIADIERVKHAIQYHDDKNYSTGVDFSFSTPYHVLTIADDLDAFGYIGVYRYIEIYLLRGMSCEQIAANVCVNLDKRFLNFSRWCSPYDELYAEHKVRHNKTKHYFEALINEVEEIGYQSFYMIGAMGVFNLLKEYLNNQHNVLSKAVVEKHADTYIVNFLKELQSEIR